jgi:hypothetical protein
MFLPTMSVKRNTTPRTVPGYIKITRAELSLGREFTAACMVLNSPLKVPDPRTTTAPEGGVVRDTRFSSGLAAPPRMSEKTYAAKRSATRLKDNSICMMRCSGGAAVELRLLYCSRLAEA